MRLNVVPQLYTSLTVKTSALARRSDASQSMTGDVERVCEPRRLRQTTVPLSHLDPDMSRVDSKNTLACTHLRNTVDSLAA